MISVADLSKRFGQNDSSRSPQLRRPPGNRHRLSRVRTARGRARRCAACSASIGPIPVVPRSTVAHTANCRLHCTRSVRCSTPATSIRVAVGAIICAGLPLPTGCPGPRVERGTRAGGADVGRRTSRQDLLAGYAPTARACRRDARRSAHGRARRTCQWSRSGRNPLDPRCAGASRIPGTHRARQQPPALRDGADGQRSGRDRPGQIDRAMYGRRVRPASCRAMGACEESRNRDPRAGGYGTGGPGQHDRSGHRGVARYHLRRGRRARGARAGSCCTSCHRRPVRWRMPSCRPRQPPRSSQHSRW